MTNNIFKCTEHSVSFDTIDKLENHFKKTEHGEFKCFEHERAFNDLDKFNSHLAQLDHTQKGVAPCKVCDKPVEYTFLGKMPSGLHKPICGDCNG